MGKRIEREKILVVEGKNDKELFEELLVQGVGIGDVQVWDANGKDNIRQTLLALTKDPSFHTVKSFGVVRDADESPRDAFRSVCDALDKSQLPVPPSPGHIVNRIRRVGVYILPNGKDGGSLETLCCQSVFEQCKGIKHCVEQFVECVVDCGINLPQDMDKVQFYAWISTQRRPEWRLGEAAKAGAIPLNTKSFGPLRDFLRRLFR